MGHVIAARGILGLSPSQHGRDVLDEIAAYTLSRGDPAFIHQHVIDAAGAQFADERTTPIQLAFSLIGLYLYVERGYTGRDVQRVHAKLAARKLPWPAFVLPEDRGRITPMDVLAAPEGAERDAAIAAWCASVWASYEGCKAAVVALLEQRGIL